MLSCCNRVQRFVGWPRVLSVVGRVEQLIHASSARQRTRLTLLCFRYWRACASSTYPAHLAGKVGFNRISVRIASAASKFSVNALSMMEPSVNSHLSRPQRCSNLSQRVRDVLRRAGLGTELYERGGGRRESGLRGGIAQIPGRDRNPQRDRATGDFREPGVSAHSKAGVLRTGKIDLQHFLRNRDTIETHHALERLRLSLGSLRSRE